MNLSESMKHVLKARSQNIFNDFWKDDVVIILKEFKNDVADITSSGAEKFKTLREQGIKETMLDIKDSAVDTIEIFKIIPQRVKEAFAYFRDDLLNELELQPDSRQKTIFALKVIGALSSFTISALYGVKNSKSNLSFSGLKIRNAFTQFIVTELVLKLTRLFILRFMNEMEQQLTEEEDLKNMRFFKSLLSDYSRKDVSIDGEIPTEIKAEPGDRAVKIVEALKNYIITGKKSDE